MAILEDIGGFASGLAEGGAQGTQLALQQERIDALGRAENIREERFDLERPLIEEDIAGIEDRKKLRIAALDEQQSKAEIASAEAAKVEDFRSIGDFFVETLGEVATPSMVQKFEERFRLTHGSSINKPGMINRKQFEEFFEDFREAPDFKETYTDIFTSGIAESEERKGVLNTELSKLSEKGPPDQKAFEKGKQLQAEIAEHEEAKNIFNRMIGRVSDISVQEESLDLTGLAKNEFLAEQDPVLRAAVDRAQASKLAIAEAMSGIKAEAKETAAQKELGRKAKPIQQAVAELDQMVDNVFTAEGLIDRAFFTAEGKIANTAQFNETQEDIILFNTLSEALVPPLARFLTNEKGPLTESDKAPARALMPVIGDSKIVAQKKMALVKRLLQGAAGGKAGKSASKKTFDIGDRNIKDMSIEELVDLRQGE